jgi:hypothetical protein
MAHGGGVLEVDVQGDEAVLAERLEHLRGLDLLLHRLDFQDVESVGLDGVVGAGKRRQLHPVLLLLRGENRVASSDPSMPFAFRNKSLPPFFWMASS